MLYLVRGLPGSGKSSYAVTYILTGQADIHLEADMYFVEDNRYNFFPELLYKAHSWCQETTRIFLANGKNVIVSNTFTTRKELEPYIVMAKELNVPVKIYRCTQDYGSIHNVPTETIERMRNRFINVPEEIYVKKV